MLRVVLNQEGDEFAPDAVSLAARPHCDAHEVTALALSSGQKGSIPYDCASVGFARHDYLVHLRLPEGAHNLVGVVRFTESFSLDDEQLWEHLGFVLLGFFEKFDFESVGGSHC